MGPPAARAMVGMTETAMTWDMIRVVCSAANASIHRGKHGFAKLAPLERRTGPSCPIKTGVNVLCPSPQSARGDRLRFSDV